MLNAASSLYIHFPFCLSKCAYCDFFSVPAARNAREQFDGYLSALAGGISRQNREGILAPLKTIYIGGGTPSLLTPRDIESLLARIDREAGIESGAEITLEANISGVSAGFLRGMAQAGITRLSAGLQSFNRQSLSAVHRRRAPESFMETLSAWRGTLSIDMIAGLPFETEESFATGLETALCCSPHHVSLYALTVEEHTPLARDITAKRVPYDKDFADLLWIFGRDFLESRGYAQYEVSNFALPGYECAHNIAYWRLQSYAGAGAGAVGTLFFADGRGERRAVSHDIGGYIRGSERIETEILDKKTVMFEYVMMGLRMREGICGRDFFARFGEPLEEKIGARVGVFASWLQKGMAEHTGSRYALTREGILFLNDFLIDESLIM
ncbi:MAG: radical SAM family heme chaperone HemW [Treponemataceae bacterium]|nr:MAG: radical SAM family heme chaperone HemW [Treponemataceae bacterium]